MEYRRRGLAWLLGPWVRGLFVFHLLRRGPRPYKVTLAQGKMQTHSGSNWPTMVYRRLAIRSLAIDGTDDTHGKDPAEECRGISLNLCFSV